jgi:hypothetical protein
VVKCFRVGRSIGFVLLGLQECRLSAVRIRNIEVLALQGQQDLWFGYGSWVADFQGHSIEDVVLSGLQIEGLVFVGLQY